MATVAIKQSVFPVSKVIADYVEQTENQMRWNMETQRIWPTEVYPGYAKINAERKRQGGWYSTGEGIKSIRGRVISATTAGDVTVQFSYLDHLSFADMGVGMGTKWEDVETARKVNYRNRYISRWDRPQGSSHRPALLATIRHFAHRVNGYLADFYGITEPMMIVRSLDLNGVINI